MLFQRTDCLHQSTFKVMADTHNLTGSLHLSGKCSLCCNKFIKGQTRNLNYTVVQHRLKACVGFTGNGIWNLIQSISQSNLGSNLGNRITGSFTSQCRRTAYSRINLNYTIFKAFRMKGVLYITSTCDSQFCDNI